MEEEEDRCESSERKPPMTMEAVRQACGVARSRVTEWMLWIVAVLWAAVLGVGESRAIFYIGYIAMWFLIIWL